MRYLFLPDELEAFRPVAAAIQDIRAEFVMLRQFSAVRLSLDWLHFDAVIIGANAIDSPMLGFLRQSKPAFLPALGVTCVSWMLAELTGAGAGAVLLLPDEATDLVPVLRALAKRSEH